MASVDFKKLAHVYTVGDTLPSLTFVYKDVDITGYTIELLLERVSPNTLLTKTATIVDAAQGKFRIDWVAGDLTAGCNYATIKVTDGGGGTLTASQKILIEVLEAPA